jgi:DNA-binding PadR family transcriptional regulator
LSATRMLVLGVVRLAGEAHGHQVRRELLSWSADKWANVQPGSLYHALKALTKDGLLEAVGTVEGGEGPARTIYKITAKGTDELLHLVSNALSDAEAPPDHVAAAVTMIPLLPRPKLISLLERRLSGLEATLPVTERAVGSYPQMGAPAHVSELARLWVVHVEGQIKWTRELLARLRAGEYDVAD